MELDYYISSEYDSAMHCVLDVRRASCFQFSCHLVLIEEALLCYCLHCGNYGENLFLKTLRDLQRLLCWQSLKRGGGCMS